MKLTKRIKKKFSAPNDPDKSWIEIKHLKINEIKKIEAKANTISYEDGNTKIEFNPYTRAEMIANASLTDWGNMYNTLGKPMVFKPSNIAKAAEFKVEVDGETTDFYSWVVLCQEELDAEVSKETKVAEKN